MLGSRIVVPGGVSGRMTARIDEIGIGNEIGSFGIVGAEAEVATAQEVVVLGEILETVPSAERLIHLSDPLVEAVQHGAVDFELVWASEGPKYPESWSLQATSAPPP